MTRKHDTHALYTDIKKTRERLDETLQALASLVTDAEWALSDLEGAEGSEEECKALEARIANAHRILDECDISVGEHN